MVLTRRTTTLTLVLVASCWGLLSVPALAMPLQARQLAAVQKQQHRDHAAIGRAQRSLNGLHNHLGDVEASLLGLWATFERERDCQQNALPAWYVSVTLDTGQSFSVISTAPPEGQPKAKPDAWLQTVENECSPEAP